MTVCPVGPGRQAGTCLPLQERYIGLLARSNRAPGRNGGRKYHPGTSCRYLLLPATSIRPTEILFVSSRPFVFRIRIQSANPSPPAIRFSLRRQLRLSIHPSQESCVPACLRGFGDQETGRHDTLNASKQLSKPPGIFPLSSIHLPSHPLHQAPVDVRSELRAHQASSSPSTPPPPPPPGRTWAHWHQLA